MTPEQIVPVLMGALVLSVVVHGIVQAIQGRLWSRRVAAAKLEIYEAFIDRLRVLEGKVRALESRDTEVRR